MLSLPVLSALYVSHLLQIFERKPTTVKNFGIWVRYQSRTGEHLGVVVGGQQGSGACMCGGSRAAGWGGGASRAHGHACAAKCVPGAEPVSG
jgi:hypothetical protein